MIDVELVRTINSYLDKAQEQILSRKEEEMFLVMREKFDKFFINYFNRKIEESIGQAANNNLFGENKPVEYKNNFKVGDTVVLVKEGLAAELGATAIVTKFDAQFMYVKWIRNELARDQNDGGYYPYCFEKCSKNWYPQPAANRANLNRYVI